MKTLIFYVGVNIVGLPNIARMLPPMITVAPFK